MHPHRWPTSLRSLLHATALLGQASLATVHAAVAELGGGPKPNVVLVMTDDQGYGDLSCHGNPVLKTPHLDRLWSQSIRLTDFHVAPMCTPTRGQLLTGVDALRNGAMNVSSGRTLLRTEYKTLADHFAAGGYGTGLFGKWHLGDNFPYRPQDRGFGESIWLPSSHTPSASDYWNNDYFDDTYWHNGVRKPFQGYCTDVFFNEAMRWMRARARDNEPFFCYIPLNAPHGPLFVPDQYREPYRNLRPAVASFFGMIANIDENMGRLDAFLRETGLADNTLLIFMTDNGTATGESVYNAGMRGKKISLHDGGHRVPFFLRWSAGKLRPAGDVPVLAQAQDVVPTLLELCGLPATGGARFDGVSLAGVLRGERDTIEDRMLVVQFSRMNKPRPEKNDAAVLWNRWRWVSGTELHNLDTDPGQERNVIQDHPDVADRMRRHYESWWAGVEPRVHEFSPIHVGSDRENPVMLTPCEWGDVFLDQAAQVRRGEAKNGVWALEVEREGEYEFALRRWPREVDAGLGEGVPEYRAVDGVYPAGKALPVARARLKVGHETRESEVRAADREARFRVKLGRGQMELRTWFEDASGKELCGAYYVYVTRLL